jgi:hypothetical protein
MPRIKIAGTNQYAVFPDGMTRDEMAEAMETNPVVLELRKKNEENSQESLRKEFFKSQQPSTPFDTLKSIGTGLGTLGQDIDVGGKNLINNILELTGRKSRVPVPQRMDIGKIFGAPKAEGIQGLFQESARYAPLALATGGLGLAGEVGAGVASEGLRENSTPESTILGGLTNLLIGGGARALEKLRPSNILKSNLSPEQLKENLRISKGTETPLGRIIESPELSKKFENELSKSAYSDAQASMGRTSDLIHKKGENLLTKRLGIETPENITHDLEDALNNSFKEHQKNKNNLYDEFNDLAEKHNIKADLSNFASQAKEYKEGLEDSALLKHDPETKKLISKLSNFNTGIKIIKSDILDAKGNPIRTMTEYPTLKEANLLKGKLNQYANIARSDPNLRHTARTYGNLASSLKSDIENSIEKSENAKLKNAYEAAENNYKKNFSPFLDKQIYKADPDTIIQNFVKNSKTSDRARLLSKFMDKLPEDKKNLVVHGYLSRALDNEGNLSPLKMKTLINNLRPNQFKALVADPDLRRELKDFSKLTSMNDEALNRMLNPRNGSRTLEILNSNLPTAIAGAQFASLPGALAALAAKKLVTKHITKKLTSEPYRESLIKAMLDKKQLPYVHELSKALQFGAQSTIGDFDKGQ